MARLLMERHQENNAQRERIKSIWYGIRSRCFSEKNPNYPLYGGRGITMSYEWANIFDAFYQWSLVNGYADRLEIDRIDVNGSYEPSNCRWATRAEQVNNRRNTVYVDYRGKRVTLTELAKITGICRGTINVRYHDGLRGEELSAPLVPVNYNRFAFFSEEQLDRFKKAQQISGIMVKLKFRKEDAEIFHDLYFNKGMSSVKISKKFNCYPSTIMRVISNLKNGYYESENYLKAVKRKFK